MTQLGKYELYEQLGRGGYGTVYRAQDTVLDVERAVKVLHPALIADPDFIARFRQEARLAARLEHPNIVPVYDLGEDGGSIFLTMRLMPGGSLKERIEKDGRLPFAEALRITRQIAAALDHAYGQAGNLVHRDVKPGNVLFEADGTARLADFGFAKALEGANSASLSASGGMIGTPAYMAPEVWDGQPASPASDTYSLGCAVYEMLTGQSLFGGGTASPSQIMKRHFDTLALPQEWSPDAPAGLTAVLEKALAKGPAERYSSAGAFAWALEALTAAPHPAVPQQMPAAAPQPIPPQAQPAPLTAKPAPARQGLPKWAWIVGGVAALLVIVVGISALSAGKKPQPTAEPLTAQSTTQEVIAPTVIASATISQATAAPPPLPGETNTPISNDTCLACHGQPGNTYTLPNGDILDLYVDAQAYSESDHGGELNLRCVSCHAEVGGYPHPLLGAASLQDVSVEYSQACGICHLSMCESAQMNPQVSVDSSLAPAVCSDCHQTHQSGVKAGVVVEDARGIEMALIPAGSFQMGSDADDALAECQKFYSYCQGYWFTPEEPVHAVTISQPFYMDMYEVTNALYAACVADGSCTAPDNTSSYSYSNYYGNPTYYNYPVIYVDWNQANEYCTWRGSRLPTEAEWEYAARGGLEGMDYPWGDTFDGSRVNYCDTNCPLGHKDTTYNDGYADTAPVGSYAPNDYGLYDMAGNVWEWVNDWYGDYPSGVVADPGGPSSGDYRVLRGGSWYFIPSSLRVATRLLGAPDQADEIVGIRCARSP